MYLQITPIGRSQGRSAVAAAAYRSGERIRDERTGKLHNFSNRDDVPHKEIMLPSGLNAERIPWVRDRARLWNAAERAEQRRDSRVAREFLVNLPHELSAERRVNLARVFSQELSDRYRVVIDLAVHLPRKGSDPRNHHAHLMLSSREITPSGFGGKAGLDQRAGKMRAQGLREGIAEIKFVRERWATLASEALREANVDVRVDHRTLAAQGIDRPPRARVPWSTVMRERRGLRSEIGERVRANHLARVQAKKQRQSQQSLQSLGPMGSHESSKQAQPSLGSMRTGETPTPQKLTIGDVQHQAREAWAKMRRGAQNAPNSKPSNDRGDEHAPEGQSPEDDLSL
jgi:hypothetical protein